MWPVLLSLLQPLNGMLWIERTDRKFSQLCTTFIAVYFVSKSCVAIRFNCFSFTGINWIWSSKEIHKCNRNALGVASCLMRKILCLVTFVKCWPLLELPIRDGSMSVALSHSMPLLWPHLASQAPVLLVRASRRNPTLVGIAIGSQWIVIASNCWPVNLNLLDFNQAPKCFRANLNTSACTLYITLCLTWTGAIKALFDSIVCV